MVALPLNCFTWNKHFQQLLISQWQQKREKKGKNKLVLAEICQIFHVLSSLQIWHHFKTEAVAVAESKFKSMLLYRETGNPISAQQEKVKHELFQELI